MKSFAVAKKRSSPSSLRRHVATAPSAVAHRLSTSEAVRQILRGPRLRGKLTTGAPDDIYQDEADSLVGEMKQTSLPMVQRKDGPSTPSDSLQPTSQEPPGRVPSPEEQRQWGDYFPKLTEFRILVEPAYGYNCFAWAVGVDNRSITSDTLVGEGYSPDLDGWTRYLKDKYGFARYANGADTGADLVLFGKNEHMVWHAARKAEQPVGRMTFSSKLGDYGKTPVILHALPDIEGKAYGSALRSFWRVSESEKPVERSSVQ